MINVGLNIKKLREFKNLTQDFVAQELGISQSSYARIESGEGDVVFSKVEKIAEILGVNLNDLINFNDKYVFNNYAPVQQNGVFNFSSNEKELYEKQILLLQEENKYLKALIDNLSKRN